MTSTTTRCYPSLEQSSAPTDEVAYARIWAGFHYRFSTRVGQDMGHKIGRHVVDNATGEHRGRALIDASAGRAGMPGGTAPSYTATTDRGTAGSTGNPLSPEFAAIRPAA